ncbi:PrpF domain-containing protein [Bordetella petrii]|uniref:PrpF domain-containing protein n=1 Tax=Bordetella petrii TaxID=94624 RepID=UPI001E35DBD5|nr:PrpF domain-containing protein [Bordetella petrii]MCD0502657.1 3-methylitaconate isomerase [Bordetella petrii]
MSTIPESLEFVLMRGGTSKGVFLRQGDVPRDRAALQALLLDIFGSPDRRQIDGLGGADKLTSKAAIIGPPTRPDTDVTYLFGQVGILAAEVDFNLNCGNLTAAVGVYAIQQGLVAAREGTTTVRVHNVNTDRVVHVLVPVRDGTVRTEGPFSIGGVPGTGAAIGLDFSRAVGAITGRLLPLESARSRIAVPQAGEFEVSVVDGANLVVYAQARDFGLTGIEDPAAIDGDTALRGRMDAVRRHVAHSVGLEDYFDARSAPSTPMLVLLRQPHDYRSCTDSAVVPAAAQDLVCRQYASGSVSKTLAATVTATTGMACGIAGSLPARLLARRHEGGMLAFGHPSGLIHVDARVASGADGWSVERAIIQRTARRLAEGRVYLHAEARP